MENPATSNEREAEPSSLTDSRRLGGNMMWNLLGMGLPILVALISLPPLIGLLGEARFGVLTIAWLVFGYFSIFDMGMHRALTRLVSKALGESDPERITNLFLTSLFLMMLAGLFGAAVVYLNSSALVDTLKIPGDLSALLQHEIRQETLMAFFLVAIGLPVLTSTAGLRGMLEAHQQFSNIAIMQLWHGTWTFLGPLLVAWLFKPDLAWVVGSLLAGRLLTWLGYFVLAVRVAPQVWDNVRVERQVMKPLLSFGGWMTLASLVGPIILYGDRFVIGMVLNTEAVAHYVTPAEIVLKILIIPYAIIGVLFPAFAMTFDTQRERTVELFGQGVRVVLLLLMPVAIVVVTLAPELLSFWIGMGLNSADAQSFTLASAPVMQLLAIGALINGFALIPTALIQACGKPAWVAVLYCLELPIWYYSMLWLTQTYGVTGAASAWIFRQVVDLAALLYLSRKLMVGRNLQLLRPVLLLALGGGASLLLVLISDFTARVFLGAFFVVMLTLLGWKLILDDEQRTYVMDTVEKYRLLLLDRFGRA